MTLPRRPQWADRNGRVLGRGGYQAWAAAAAAALLIGPGAALLSARTAEAATGRAAVVPAGPAYAWGFNESGQLGDGTVVQSAVPEELSLPSGTAITEVVEQSISTLALTSLGQVLASGDNTDGELGNGTTVGSELPVPVSMPAGTVVTAIAGESSDGLALTSTGTVDAWGTNPLGQLGNGTTARSERPVPVSFPAGTVITAIAGESNDGLALTSAGKLFAWGRNNYGQLGDGTLVGSDTPVPVSFPPGTVVTAVAGEAAGGLALLSSGAVWAWGYNGEGQLGNGTAADSDVPTAVDLPAGTTVTAIAGEGYSGLALSSTGTVLAWGDNQSGDLGDGSSGGQSDLPVPVVAPAGAGAITAVGSEVSGGLALTATGQVLAWGDNTYGDLGYGSSVDQNDVATMVDLPVGTAATAVARGFGLSGLAVTGPPPATSSQTVFVTDTADNAVTSYAPGATGDTAPLTALSGPSTGLSTPKGVAVNAAGDVFVANNTADTITEYAPGATGDAAPLATLAGPATELHSPQGLTFDPNGDLCVADSSDNTVTEYSPGARGDTAPAHEITGVGTRLDAPHALAFDTKGDLFVADNADNAVTEYGPGDFSAGDATPPIATISGAGTGLSKPFGLIVDGLGHLQVADIGSARITAYDAGASGDATPRTVLGGGAAKLSSPAGIAINALGQVAVADASPSAVTFYAESASGNTAPIESIAGPATGLDGPEYVAFSPDEPG